MKRMSRRAWITLTVVAVAALAAFGAYAYWTTSASGTGTAATGTNTALTIVQTSTVTGLYPDGPAQPLEYTIENTADFDQAIASVTVAITSVAPGACAASNFALVQPTQSPGVIAAGGTFDSETGSGGESGASLELVESGSNQDVCKNATVNLAYTGVGT